MDTSKAYRRLVAGCGRLARLRRARAGTTAIEYALIAGSVSIFILIAVTATGGALRGNFYDEIAAMLSAKE